MYVKAKDKSDCKCFFWKKVNEKVFFLYDLFRADPNKTVVWNTTTLL